MINNHVPAVFRKRCVPQPQLCSGLSNRKVEKPLHKLFVMQLRIEVNTLHVLVTVGTLSAAGTAGSGEGVAAGKG